MPGFRVPGRAARNEIVIRHGPCRRPLDRARLFAAAAAAACLAAAASIAAAPDGAHAADPPPPPPPPDAAAPEALSSHAGPPPAASAAAAHAGGFDLVDAIGDPFPVKLQLPAGLAWGSDGSIIVADALGGHLEVYYENGTHAREVGTKGHIDAPSLAAPAIQRAIYGNLTTQGYVDPGSPAWSVLNSSLDRLRHPYGVHVEGGTVYVADSRNLRVLAFNESTWEPIRAYPVWSSPYDVDVARDSTGDVMLVVADSSRNQILFLNATTGVPIERLGKNCNANGTLGCEPGDGNGEFRFPLSVVATDDALYVADTGNGRIQVLNSDGSHHVSIPMPPHPSMLDPSTGEAAPLQPVFLAVVGPSEIMASALGSDTVYTINMTGHILERLGSSTSLGGPQGVLLSGDEDDDRVYVASGGAGSAPLSGSPDCLTCGIAYIEDGGYGSVQVFNGDGTLNATIGRMDHGPLEFGALLGIAAGPDGRIIAADSGNDRVQFVRRADNGSFVHDGMFGARGAGDGQFRLPVGAAAAPGGDVLVADSGNDRVQRFHANGTYKSQFNVTGADGLPASPRGLDVGPDGSVHVAAPGSGAVLVFSPGGELVRSINGSGAFRTPTGVDVGPDGRVYVADESAGRVHVLGADGTALFTVGEPALQSQYLLPGHLRHPHDVAVDSNGRIIVVDTVHDRLQVFDHAGGFVTSAGSFGFCPHPDCVGDGIQFDRPYAVASGPGNTVYVADSRNHRIVVLEARDSDPPSIEAVAATRVSTGPDSSAVYVSVTFDEQMRVYQRNGSAPPSVGLAIAGEPAEAAYAWGSGTRTLVFAHDAAQGGSGPADGYVTYASAEPFALNNGSITDAAGNRAGLAMPRMGAEIASAEISAGNEIVVSYSGPVHASASDYANLTLSPGGPRAVASLSGSGTSEHTVTFGGAPAPAGASAAIDIAELGDRPPSHFAGASAVPVADGREGFSLAGLVGEPFPVQLQYPTGLAEGAGGTIVVADSRSGQVAVYAENGTFVREMATKGYIDLGIIRSPEDQLAIYGELATRGYVGGESTGAALLASAPGALRLPQGLAVRDGAVYVADTLNLRVQALDERTGRQIALHHAWSNPYDIDFSPDGGLLAIADAPRNQVFFLNATTGLPVPGTSIGGSCAPVVGCLAGDGDGEFNFPLSVRIADNGTLYVADTGNSRIQSFAANGTHLSSIMMPAHPTLADPSTGEPVRLPPVRLDINDETGTIVVSAASADSVYELDGSGGIVRQFGGPGTFDTPEGVLVHSSGRVYVADAGGDRILAFNADGTLNATIAAAGHGPLEFGSLFGIAVEPGGGRIIAVDSGNDRVQFVRRAANGSFVHDGSFGSRGAGDGQFRFPTGVAVAPGGDIFVAEHTGQRVQRFNASGAYVSQFNATDAAGAPASLRGIAMASGGSSLYAAAPASGAVLEFSLDGALARSINGSGAFLTPTSIAVGADGRMYVADESAGRVHVLPAGGGPPLFSVGMPAAPGLYLQDGRLQHPHDVAVDSNGRIIVADTGHDRIQVFDHAGRFVQSAGSFGFCPHPDCLGHGIQFDRPYGLAAGPGGTVYVADSRNHRMAVLEPGDSDPPSIEAVAATRVSTGRDSSVVYVSVTFDEQMRVYQRDGSAPPSVGLAIAGEPAEAAYAWGSGTRTLVFAHDAAQGGSGPADGYVTYASAEPFALNNGSITDAAGNRAGLAMPRMGAEIASAEISAGNEIVVSYSGPVHASASDYANLTLSPGGPRAVASLSGSGTSEHTVTFGGAPAPAGASAAIDIAELGDRPPSHFAGASAVPVADGREGFSLAGLVGEPFPVQLQYPTGLAEGAGGTIVVADSRSGHIAVYREDGTLVREMGAKGSLDLGLVRSPADQLAIYGELAARGYVGDASTGAALLASAHGALRQPQGLAVRDGVVYVADMLNLRVQALDERTGRQLALYPVWSNPYDVALSPDGGAMAVADAPRYHVMFLNATDGLPLLERSLGQGCAPAVGCQPGDGDGEFRFPLSVAFAANGTLYVADTYNARIQAFAANGTHLSSIMMPEHPSEVDPSTGEPARALPVRLDVNGGQGTIVVSTSSPDAVYEMDGAGRVVRQFGPPGLFDEPEGVLVHSSGMVYVADGGGDSLLAFNADGTLNATIATAEHGPLEFGSLFGIAVEEGGRIAVVDSGNDRVQFVRRAANGSFVHDGSFGSRGAGDGQFRFPTGIAIAPGGDVLVAENVGQRIQRFDAAGAYKSQFNVTGADGLPTPPRGIDVGPGGSVYVAAPVAGAVLVFSPGGELERSFNGSGAFLTPTSIAVGADGRMYVADESGGRVHVLAADGTALFAVGEPAGPGLYLQPARLQHPHDVAVDANGRIIVADTGHDRLQVFDHAGGFVQSAGSFGFCPHPDCLGHGIQFDRPYGLTAGPGGTVYVADSRNHRMVVLEPGDADAPSIESIGVSVNATGAATASVVFDEPMRVYQRDGSAPPSLMLRAADGQAAAPYASGAGTATLVFGPVQAPGGGPAEPASAEPFALNNGSITDAAGNRADLAAPRSEPPPRTDPVVVAAPQPGTGQFFPGGGGGGGGGRGGGGGGSAPSSYSAIAISSVSWDCNDATMRITVGVEAGGAGRPAEPARPDVSVLSQAGTAEASAAGAAGAAGAGTFAYEAPLPEDSLVLVRATLVDGRTVHDASETVRTGGQCVGQVAFGAPAGGDAPGGAAAAGAAPGGERPSEAEAETEARPESADGMEAEADAPPTEPEAEAEAEAQQPQAPPMPETEADAPQPPAPMPPPSDGDAPAAGESADAQPAAEEGTDAPAAAAVEGGEEGGGCLVATAAYGTELAPQVQALREVRDGTVLSTGAGAAFMSAFNTAYYAVSPTVADLEREHPAVREAVRVAVAPALYAVQAASLAEPGSDASVVAYGIASISLLAAAYVAAPAAAAAAACSACRRARRRYGRR